MGRVPSRLRRPLRDSRPDTFAGHSAMKSFTDFSLRRIASSLISPPRYQCKQIQKTPLRATPPCHGYYGRPPEMKRADRQEIRKAATSFCRVDFGNPSTPRASPLTTATSVANAPFQECARPLRLGKRSVKRRPILWSGQPPRRWNSARFLPCVRFFAPDLFC